MKVDFSVTLADLRRAGACYRGYNRVVRMLQGREFTHDDENRTSYILYAHKDRIPLAAILRSNGLYDALWALRCIPDVERDARLLAVWCARQVERFITDQRSKDVLDVAERFANGNATDTELDAARHAAWHAARDADWDVACEAARAVAKDTPWNAAKDAAWNAAGAAAKEAAWNAAGTGARDAAWIAAWTAAKDAAWIAAKDAQSEMFIAMCEGRAPWQEQSK